MVTKGWCRKSKEVGGISEVREQCVKKKTVGQNISSCCAGEADHRKEQIKSALAAENTRLRQELDRICQQPAPVIIQQSAQVLLLIQAAIQKMV